MTDSDSPSDSDTHNAELDAKSPAQLIELLHSGERADQEVVARRLRDLKRDDVVLALLPLLESDDAQLRSIAIELLEEFGDVSRKHLVAVLKSGSDDAKIFALDILGRLRAEECVDEMASALDSDNVNLRNACAMALANTATETALPHLLRCLEDDEWVRFSAIEGLCKLADERVVGQLIEKLRESRNQAYYSGILASFVEIRDASTLPALLDELAHVDAEFHPEIVSAAMELIDLEGACNAVSEEQANSVREQLKALLKSEDPWTVFRAVNVIGKLYGRSEFETVVSVLRDGPNLAQAGSVRALEALATRDDVKALETAAQDTDIMIQDEIEGLIQRLKTDGEGHA